MAGGRPRKDPSQKLPSRVYLRAGSFYYVHRIDGRWENLGKDLAAVRKKAASYSAGAAVIGTMGHWLMEWLDELQRRVKAGDLAARTAADYTDAVEKLRLFFGRMDPASVEPTHVAEYLDIGRDTCRSVRANREKAALSSCYTWLVRRGIVKVNPCIGVAKNTETKRDRHISDDEYHAVFDVASPPVRAWMVLIYRTLQRPADILAWNRRTIVERDGVRALEFKQSKTGRRMSIVLNAEIDQALAALRQARAVEGMPLVPTEAGQHYTETGLASMFRRHTVEARVANFAPYDLKAKGATDMYASGVPLETICALCGHESVKTTEIYIKAHSSAPVAANGRVIPRKPSKTA